MARVLVCLLVIAMAVGLASCMTVRDTYVVSNKLLDRPPEKTGVVVGSIGLAKSDIGYHRYSLIARDLATNEKLYFYFKRSGVLDTPADFSDGRAQSAIFALRLPEGRYEIHNIEYFSVGLFGSENRVTARRDFSIPFEIKAGEGTYLGEFVAVNVPGRNLLGMRTVIWTYWEIADRQDRDVALARQRLTDAPLTTITRAVPDPEALRLPFFARVGAPPPAPDAPALH